MDVVKGEFELCDQEDVEHVDGILHRQLELDGDTGEHHDHPDGFRLLRRPVAVEARVSAKVPDGPSVIDGNGSDTVNEDVVSCELGDSDRMTVGGATYQLTLERIEAKEAETHEVLDPVVLHGEIGQRVDDDASDVRVADRRDGECMR